MNAYLTSLRTKYDSIRTGIEGLQTRAADENRDLTEDELRSVQGQGEQAAKIAAEIEQLTEIETRNAKVAGLAAQLSDAQPEETRSAVRVGGAQTRDRDPGHYRSDGGRSFFSDMFHARALHDEEATRRLIEHNRALDMGTEGPGVIPPVWMSSEFQTLARQQRRVASAVRNIPLSSAAPISMPKQTAGTDAIVATQANENDPITWTDAWDSDVDTVTPKAIAGGQKVSRQMLDSGNPAVDALIFGDLVSVYNVRIESLVVATMLASAGAAVVTHATNAGFADPEDGPDSILTAALAVRSARKLPADISVVNVNRLGSVLKWKDSTGRPLVPAGSAGPQNVLGRGDVATDGFLDSAAVAVLATDGVASTFPESILVARSLDVILFESPTTRFSFEQPEGPEIVRLGIWAYAASYVQHAGKSVKRVAITAAS
ncbi:phage major capsid protein [Pseudonocardia sp. WMMC193]|uniref:phage major capsid protein n=1 Tax=Pseudonocardia sp. WMMC193 TaxID=2911965 RepID=UPI001F0254BA|nr:phage major capsid protein [Pseudonocardia sp. WMMC193]MCF7548905.1 phage major capsid protein [Pseudonocardia sp. WMMC193]